MAYNGKTNWQLNEIVKPEDMNRIEQGIIDAYESLLTHNKSAGAHKNRFDEFVKEVTGSNATLTITKGNGTTSTVTVNNVANATNATNASKATQDSSGQQINTTYIKGLSISGRNITYTKGNGTTGTITTQDTTYNFGGTTFYSGDRDTAEHNANDCLKNGHYYYNSNGPSTSVGASTVDGGLYTQSYDDSWGGQIAQDYRNGRLFVRGRTYGTWTSWLTLLDSSNYNNYAPTKTGGGASGTWGINISGNATNDSAGQQINTTYIKGLSISGNTITYTKGNGGTGTITVPTGAGAKSYITESVVNSDGSWYRKYSDGWLEQGGIISASAIQSGSDYFYTFNFALPFSKVMTCVANSDTADVYNGNVETLTNTYFIMRQDNKRPNIKAKYIACGMG